ncbi:MAG: hypothetical protein WD894_25045 [Pirellulales bacterium]
MQIAQIISRAAPLWPLLWFEHRILGTMDGSSTIAVDHPVADLNVAELIRVRGKKALALLLQARDYATLLAQDGSDFALDRSTLYRAGLSVNDLRWLLCQRLVDHMQETTLPGDPHRRFERAGAIAFQRASCFVLTAAGVDFVREGGQCPGQCLYERLPLLPPEASPERNPEALIPTWDYDLQELRLGNKVVKRFMTPAPNQQMILAAFEEEGWPLHIDDPLPPQGDLEPKRRLHDTINSLNRHQKEPLIRFIGDGTGEGIRWQLVVDERQQFALDTAGLEVLLAPSSLSSNSAATKAPKSSERLRSR